ncbi:hypothetical protein SPRG_18043, partial [Saprolegnia parasitica CBS 223.65]
MGTYPEATSPRTPPGPCFKVENLQITARRLRATASYREERGLGRHDDGLLVVYVRANYAYSRHGVIPRRANPMGIGPAKYVSMIIPQPAR